MSAKRIVLSVSRRTDIPAFHLDWFVDGLRNGFFVTQNPVSGKIVTVPATRDKVAGFVFWSKNYAFFLERKVGEEILDRGMGVYFQFTVNSPDSILEEGVPPLEARLDQLAELAIRFGGDRISWRWDPICHWRDASGNIHHNMDGFLVIAEAAAQAGVPACITSFLDLYPKVLRRAGEKNVFFFDPPKERKREILRRMAERLGSRGMELRLCCEEGLSRGFGSLRIGSAACISASLLEKTFGPVSGKKDPGQRTTCHCTLSRDIGSYSAQACLHRCLYCYAG